LQIFSTTEITVGASLLAMRAPHSTLMLAVRALSSADLGEIARLQAMQGNFLLGIGTQPL
jgi:flagellar basal body P-ring protein FlgI